MPANPRVRRSIGNWQSARIRQRSYELILTELRKPGTIGFAGFRAFAASNDSLWRSIARLRPCHLCATSTTGIATSTRAESQRAEEEEPPRAGQCTTTRFPRATRVRFTLFSLSLFLCTRFSICPRFVLPAGFARRASAGFLAYFTIDRTGREGRGGSVPSQRSLHTPRGCSPVADTLVRIVSSCIRILSRLSASLLWFFGDGESVSVGI